MRLISTLVLAVAATSLLAGCPGPKPEKNEVRKKYFVHGDPLTLIEGAKLNKTSFVTPDNFDSFGKLALNSILEFKKKSEMKDEKVSSKEANQATTKEELEEIRSRKLQNWQIFEFKLTNQKVHGNSKLSLINLDKTFELKFELDPPGSHYVLKTARTGVKELSAEGLHYSFKDDGNTFSILLHISAEDDLTAAYFHKISAKEAPLRSLEGNDRFNYLYGPGHKARWPRDKPFKTYLCGKEAVAAADKLIEGMKPWVDLLKETKHEDKNSLLEIEIETMKEGFPPFSDLNTSCSYIVRSYLEPISESSHSLAAGTTMNIPNLNMDRFVDGDIFYFDQGYLRDDGYSFKQSLEIDSVRVPRHEFGHLIGLDHQFDEGIFSIMGYDGVTGLQTYDSKAAIHLYED